MGNLKSKIEKIEKKIRDQKSVIDSCIPIVEMSPQMKLIWKKRGLPPPIMGGLSLEKEIIDDNI